MLRERTTTSGGLGPKHMSRLMESSEISMERMCSLLLLGLLTGLIGFPAPATGGPSGSSALPNWPPRNALDLVLLLQGTDPSCLSSAQTSSITLKSLRQLIGFVPQLITSGSPTDWLYGALKTLLNANNTQGDLKHLLLWGMSQNLSWGFLDLPLVTPSSVQSQFLGPFMKSDLPTFLKICSDHLFPALKNVCSSMYGSISGSLQSMCLVLTSRQSSQMDTQFCTMFFSSLSDLLSGQCNTNTVRAVRSVTVNCAYATWYNPSVVSPSDVSTCSENDREQFILSVCADQILLNQLASQPANNWLSGYCVYSTNPGNICNYVSWEGKNVSVFSVAYCWIHDQDQFTSFLCTNPNVLDQLKENVVNQWLDPVCPTVPPTNIISTNLIQELCNYEQWSLQIVNPSTVALCEEIDRIGFTQYVCSSLEVLQKLLIVESNSWVAIFCSNVMPDPLECNYAMWYENDSGAQLKLIVDPFIVTHCSQVDENQFLFYVCNNPSLLLTLSKDANDSWVLQFCISRVCNYTTWNFSSPESSTVDLCWLIDREQLNSYLCSHKNILQNIELNGTSDISCPVNISNKTVCNYYLWTLTDLIPSILGYCAVQDMANFQTYICGNSSLVTLLKNNSETSWVSIFCNAQSNGNVPNCTDSLLNFHLQSCPNCNRTELEKTSLSVCSDQNLVRVLALFWNSSALINKFILWNMCDYSSWQMMPPPSFLVWYCWKCDSITFSDFLCNNFQLYDELLIETRIQETPICDPNKTCQYSTWDLTTLQSSLIKYCALWDAQGFTQYICRNSTIVKLLLENSNLTWVELSCFGSIFPSNTSNLCNYGEWISGWMGPVDFSTVYSCSKNDTMSFMMNVCNNSQILSAISKGPALTWTLNICYKLSPSNVLTQILVWDVCDYSQTMTFTPLMVEFCCLYDEENFFNYLCSNLTFYTVIKAQPQNFWLKPTCAPLAPTTATGALNYSIVQCHNQYSNLTSLDISLIQFCVEYDQEMFLNTFCNATISQQENKGCSWGTKLCSYYSWHGVYVHDVVVKACWASDQLNFMAGVCSDPSLLDELYSANSWVRPMCRSQSENHLEYLVKAACRYKEWGSLSSVPGSIAAFCNAYNHETYMNSVCDSEQEAVCNDTVERWWEPSYDCNYTNWEMGSIDLVETLMCWIFEKENFTTHVCAQSNVLSKLSNDSKTSWVAHVCSINPSVFNETDICLSENDKKQLQWNCSTDLSIVCPGNGLTVASFLPISICYLQNVGLNLTTPSITALYTQAVDATIILLLLLQDMQILSLSDITGVQAWVLRTVLNIISQNALLENQKTELLQTFANTLLLLIEEQSPPHSWTIIETLFNLTVSELKVCISSLQPKSAKHFLSVLLQNQTSLQVSDDYFSMIVSTLLSVQVPSEPLLFCDVVPFLRYLEPDELIRFLPPLQDNTQVLGILSRYALSLSNDKQHVLGFWLRRSTLFENLTKMDGIFLQQVGNLLPLFSLDVFLQLSAQQVVSILPSLPGDLPAPYQRVVASKVLQAPNITVQDVELMGRSVCRADVQDLKPYGQNMNISLALRRNLFRCVTRGDLLPESMMLYLLFGDLRSQDLGQLNSKSFPSLSEAICSLGLNFTQGLWPEQLLPVLSDVASVTLTAAQARVIVQKVLNPGNVSDEVLSHMGSLVLGISPTLLHQLSDNQLAKLLPALNSNADMLSSTQTLAVFRTLWTSWNVSEKLNELGSLLPSLPLILLRTRIKEILSNLSPMAGVKWNNQQALLLIREVTQMMHISNQVRSSANSLTSTNCDSLRSLLQNNTIQAMEQFREIIISLPQHVVRCALDKIITHPPSLKLLKTLSSQMIAEIQPSIVAVLPVNSCRYVLHILTSEPESVASLPQQRRYGLLDALIRCLNSAGTTSHQAQFIVLGVLAPFLKGSAYLTLSQGMMLRNVERVTNYCYPQETWLPLSQLLQEAQSFGSPNRWTSRLLERLDRLVLLLPLTSLQSLNKTALSIRWLSYVLSGERRWRKSPLGSACRKSQTVDQQAEDMQKQYTLLQRLFLTRSSSKTSVFAPECSMIRDSIVSAWGVEVLLRMTPDNFMDCLEEIGQDADIPNSELASLLARVLEIAGPVSTLPNNVLMRLGRLATKLNVQQLKVVYLRDSQIMEAFGKQQEWTMSQLNALASGFMQAQNVTAKDLNALHLVTLGHVICGLNEIDLAQIKPLEFCSAVIYLGHLSLRCTEQQFETLTRLCTSNDIFGPVSGWTEDVFLEIGSIAAGLQDMELSALVLEQIQGLTPLAISLIHPQKFAVSFSPLQLQLFSWSQAKAVTEHQRKLLDNEQMKALTLALAEDSGNQTYRAGKSHAADCSYCTLLHLSTLLPVLHVLYIVNPTVVFRHVNLKL